MLIVQFLTSMTIDKIHLSLAMDMMKIIVQALTFIETQQGFFTTIHFCMFSGKRFKYILINYFWIKTFFFWAIVFYGVGKIINVIC